MSSESDSDYSDVGELEQCKEEEPVARVAKVNSKGLTVRGKDIV